MAASPASGGVSLVERRLARSLERLPERVVILDCPPHVRRTAGDAAPTGPEAVAPDSGGVEVPGQERVRSLLEDGAGHLDAARAAYREQCRQAAVQTRELAAFAACRPAALLDRPDPEVGTAAAASRAARPAALTAVNEWAVDEVAAALALSGPAAQGLLVDAVTLVERMPATLAALESGRVDWPKARMLAEVLAPLTDDDVRGEVEERLLARADGRTLPQLRAGARRAVRRANAAAAARRLAAAIRDRSVRLYPPGTTAWPPCRRRCRCRSRRPATGRWRPTPTPAGGLVTKRSQGAADGRLPGRPILRPGENGLPPVQVALTVVAGVTTLRGGDEPGEVDRQTRCRRCWSANSPTPSACCPDRSRSGRPRPWSGFSPSGRCRARTWHHATARHRIGGDG